MNSLYPFCEDIHLHVEGRIQLGQAQRQDRTAREILVRLKHHPGLILADEVGMGKTFVALAVATSVALADEHKRPVVIMVPSSLKKKWPSDFDVFKKNCLPPELAAQVRSGEADRAEDFLKFLDDPRKRRKSIIFITHGAMSRGLSDGWIKAAIIRQALHKRHCGDQLRSALCRIMSDLVFMKHARLDEEFWDVLLATPPAEWLDVMHKRGIDPECDDDESADDAPVPDAICKILPHLDTTSLYEVIQRVPLRQSSSFEERVRDVRDQMGPALKEAWKRCVHSLKLRLPLLVLDEAHHLKNPSTKLASLFQDQEAADDADEISRGPLEGAFERMLFLTATPFQLGHHELCSVLERFSGINWQSPLAPGCGKDGFLGQLQKLRESLDAAQASAVNLDEAWGKLFKEDLLAGGTAYPDVESWWAAAMKGQGLPPKTQQLLDCYRRTQDKLKHAEGLLHPWVIRHLKPRKLDHPYEKEPRRLKLPGKAICTDSLSPEGGGIVVAGDALLPFLLAARATTNAPESRPLFAEGLASCYEAFLHTRKLLKKGNLQQERPMDVDDDLVDKAPPAEAGRWYLEQLENLIPKGNSNASAAHPKMSPTIQRTVEIWERGEKTLIFCHFIETGRVLRQRISEAIKARICKIGSEKMKCSEDAVLPELERMGKRFFVRASPARKACDAQVGELLESHPALSEQNDQLIDIVRRNVRTASSLVRFFPLEGKRLDAAAVAKAFAPQAHTGLSLKDMIRDFFVFLEKRCEGLERQEYIDAVRSIQTGFYSGDDVQKAYARDELQGAAPEQLVPNVRLANGTTIDQTRRRLMLAFNTPFYPEVLIASSVMAEGVDLHLNCSHVIHHDLCWNPSTLEQRTGRVDRVGAKAEKCGQSIRNYLPYVSETQDEKMYRVVMDREQWFNVVMGEQLSFTAKDTDKLAERIPLPAAAASELAFHLEVADPQN